MWRVGIWGAPEPCTGMGGIPLSGARSHARDLGLPHLRKVLCANGAPYSVPDVTSNLACGSLKATNVPSAPSAKWVQEGVDSQPAQVACKQPTAKNCSRKHCQTHLTNSRELAVNDGARCIVANAPRRSQVPRRSPLGATGPHGSRGWRVKKWNNSALYRAFEANSSIALAKLRGFVMVQEPDPRRATPLLLPGQPNPGE